MLQKRQPAGFFMAWFFLILAPTSLYPLPDVAFEHRMYLPSIAIIILTISGLSKLGLVLSTHFIPDSDARKIFLNKTGQYAMLLLILAMAISTYTRNLYYQTELSIWADNVVKRPQSARAQVNLGKALCDIDKPVDAIRHLQRGISLIESQRIKASPQNFIIAYNNMGVAYLKLGRWKTAEYYLRKSLQIKLDGTQARIHANAHTNLGRALFILKENDEARFHFQQAILLRPNFADAHANYGVYLRVQGNLKDAEEHYQAALNLSPGHIEASNGMGMVLYQQGRYREARTYFQKVLALKADNEFARNMLMELDKKERP
jgi:tetratricopeptide (TPR) repeat protein